MAAEPTSDRVIERAARRCRVRVFSDEQVAVVSNARGAPLEALAVDVEQELDVRFLGSSWRLLYVPRPRLVTFRSYDGEGRLCGPERLPVPPVLAPVVDAVC